MPTTHSPTVASAARAAFPHADLAPILALLAQYGLEPYERECERVQLTLIRLCKGDPLQLPRHLAVAKVDYRDTLVFADRPIP